jgi:quercetin dioxygenase-like cupin family protein
VPFFGVVLQGQLEISLKNGKKNIVKAGDALAEVVNTAHSGKNIGTEPVQLLIFYAGAAGQANSASLMKGN